MTLAHEMERIGRIVAADRSLEVTLRGVEAYSTPGKVNLPNIESLSWLRKRSNARRMMHGLLDHETAHAVLTDHQVMAAAKGTTEGTRYVSVKYRTIFTPDRMRELKRRAGDALGFLFNAIEDAWIERLQGERYPGAATNLHQKNRWFFDKAKPELGRGDLWADFMLALSLVGRGSVSIDEFSGWPELHNMLNHARPFLDEINDCTDSGTALDISVRVHEYFQDPPPPPPPAPGGSGEEDDDQEDDDQEDEGDDSSSGGESGDDDQDEDEGATGGGSGEDDGSDTGDDTDDDPEGTGAAGGESDDTGDEDPEDQDGEDGDESPSKGGSGDEGSESEGESDDDTEASEGSGRDVGSGDKAGDDEGSGDEDSDDRPPLKGLVPMDLERWTKGGGSPLTPEDEIARVLRSVFESPATVQPYTVFSNEWDYEKDLSSVPYPRADRWTQMIEESQEAADTLTQTFEMALKAKRQKRPISGADFGEVDAEAMIEYSVGSRLPDTIYTEWVADDDRDVAVSILVDCSGSMSGPKAQLARLTATAMHRALATVGIEHEVTGFTCVDSQHATSHEWVHDEDLPRVRSAFAEMRSALVEAHGRGTDVTKFARAIYRWGSPHPASAPLLVPAHAIFKSFGAQDARGLCWIEGIHENLDGEAVMWQARRLAQRQEPRRVMFVLSDGLPAGSRDNAQGARYLKESIEKVEEAGIEIYGVGIQSAHVKQYYSRSWVAHDVEQLCSVAMEGMIEVLTEARTERKWVDVA